MPKKNKNLIKKGGALLKLLGVANDPRLQLAMAAVSAGAAGYKALKANKKRKQKKNAEKQLVRAVAQSVSAPRRRTPPERSDPWLRAGTRLDPVVRRYILAACDPWSAGARGCNIPTQVCGPSYKVCCVARVSVVAGATCGWFCFAPTIVNDKVAFLYTNNSAYTGTAFDTTAAGGTNITAGQLVDLPFVTADITGMSVQGRVVAAGYRITYTGAESTKQGVYSMISFPDRLSVNGIGSSSTPTVSSIPMANTRAVDRRRLSDSIFPINEHEVAFSNTDNGNTSWQVYPFGNGAAITSTIPATAGIFIQGAHAGSTFEVEIIQHVEYIGRKSQPFATASFSNPQQFSQVTAALGNLEWQRTGYESGDDPNKRINDVLRFMNGSTVQVHNPKTSNIEGGLYANTGSAVF